MLLNSYINLDVMREKQKDVLQKLPYRLDLEKTKNTMSIMAYYHICYRFTNGVDTYNPSILEMCCKAVCHKYRYKYTQPHSNLYRCFWNIGNSWQNCCVNIVDLCEISYHLRNKKFRNLYNLLWNFEFRFTHSSCAIYTILYLTDYVNLETNKNLKAVIICLMFMYIQTELEALLPDPYFNKKSRTTLVEKSYELIEDIDRMTSFPRYLKKFIINTIQNGASMLQNA